MAIEWEQIGITAGGFVTLLGGALGAIKLRPKPKRRVPAKHVEPCDDVVRLERMVEKLSEGMQDAFKRISTTDAHVFLILQNQSKIGDTVGDLRETVAFIASQMGRNDADCPISTDMPPKPSVDRGGLLLLVDDRPESTLILHDKLNAAGFSVTVVDSEEAARAALMAAPYPSAVIDASLTPGGMEGVELARDTKKDYPDTCVIIVSGYESLRDMPTGCIFHKKRDHDEIIADLKKARFAK